VLKSHVILWLEADTCAEDVGQSSTLLSKSVDNWGSGRSERRLQHIGEDAEDTVKALVILCGNTIGLVCLPADTSHHLSDNGQVQDQRACEKRVFTHIGH